MGRPFFNTQNFVVFVGGGIVLFLAGVILAVGDLSAPSADALQRFEFRGPVRMTRTEVEVRGTEVVGHELAIPDGPTVSVMPILPHFVEVMDALESATTETTLAVQVGGFPDDELYGLRVSDASGVTRDVLRPEEALAQRSRGIMLPVTLCLAGLALSGVTLGLRRRFLRP